MNKTLVLVGLSAFLLAASAPPPKKRMHRAREATAVGKPFPDFSGTTLNGRQIDGGVFRGRVTLVSAWRIGCAFCMLEIPEYNSLVDSIADPRFQVISFAPQTRGELEEFYGSDTSKAPAAARYQMGIPVPKYDVLPMCSKKREKDPNVLTVQCDALEDLLGADGFPVTFIVGPDGTIRHRHDGLLADPITLQPQLGRFKAELDSLLRTW
jgi:thiol-disulfide isomerase/thioredoxin